MKRITQPLRFIGDGTMTDTAVHMEINRAVGAGRGIEAPQILADQLTLSQPDGAGAIQILLALRIY